MNKKLKQLYLTNGVFIVATALLGPLYVLFAATFNATPIVISLTWATMLATGLITLYIVSKKCRDSEVASVSLVRIGYIISAISWVLFIFATNIYHIFFIQALLGVGLSIGSSSWNLLVADHLDKNKKVVDYAEWGMLSKLIELLSIVFGGIIITTLGYKPLFLIMALLSLTSAIWLNSLKNKILYNKRLR